MKPQQGKGQMKNKINQVAKQSKAAMVAKPKAMPPVKKEVMAKGSPQKGPIKPVKVQPQKPTVMKAMPAKKVEPQKNSAMPEKKKPQAIKTTVPAMATVKRVLPQAKAAKKQNAPRKVVPPRIVKEEMDDDDDDDDDDDNDEEEVDESPIKKDVDDEDEDIANEEEEDEEQDEGDNDDVEDDEDEAAIASGNNDETDEGEKNEVEEKTSKAPKKQSDFKTTKISFKYPSDKIIMIKNLPNNYKLENLVNILQAYGTLHTVNLIQAHTECFAYIAFTDAESANAAAALNGTNIDGNAIIVRVKREMEESRALEYNCAVVVRLNGRNISEAKLREHFALCGEIKYVKFFGEYGVSSASIVFGNMEAVQSALQLDNTEIDGESIVVTQKVAQISLNDAHRTVVLRNVQGLDRIPRSKIESIFEECGPIEKIHVFSKKRILAFVMFKDEESVQQALQLSGNKVEGLEINVAEYETLASILRTIFVHKLRKDTTEEDLRDLFSQAGEIDNVSIYNGTATIKFKDVEGYCRSFLLHEAKMRTGQAVHIAPFTKGRKDKLWGNQRKRPSNEGMGNGHFKKFRTNFGRSGGDQRQSPPQF